MRLTYTFNFFHLSLAVTLQPLWMKGESVYGSVFCIWNLGEENLQENSHVVRKILFRYIPIEFWFSRILCIFI